MKKPTIDVSMSTPSPSADITALPATTALPAEHVGKTLPMKDGAVIDYEGVSRDDIHIALFNLHCISVGSKLNWFTIFTGLDS